MFLLGYAANRDLLGCPADLLQSHAEEHGTFNRPFEMQIKPSSVVQIDNWPLLRRNASNGYRPVARMAASEPRHRLLKVAHVARIFSS